MKWEASYVDWKLANFLMAFRNAPYATTNVIRTRLDALKPDLRRDMAAKQMSQAIRPTGEHRDLTVGQSVAVRNYLENEKWVSGTVVSSTGPVSYQVGTTPDVIWRRHIEQLRDASSTNSAPISLPKAAIVLPSGDPPSSCNVHPPCVVKYVLIYIRLVLVFGVCVGVVRLLLLISGCSKVSPGK